LRLREKLYLADTAAAEFHIVPLHRYRAMPLMSMDLPLD